jgi:hypothetical protein
MGKVLEKGINYGVNGGLGRLDMYAQQQREQRLILWDAQKGNLYLEVLPLT